MGKHRHEPETLYRDTVYGMRVRDLVPFSDGWEAAQCPNGFGLSGRMTARHGDPLAAGAVTVDDPLTDHVYAEMQAGPNYFGPGLDNLKGITRARR